MRAGWNLVLSGHTLMPGSRGVGPRVKKCPETSCSIWGDFCEAPAVVQVSVVRVAGQQVGTRGWVDTLTSVSEAGDGHSTSFLRRTLSLTWDFFPNSEAKGHSSTFEERLGEA